MLRIIRIVSSHKKIAIVSLIIIIGIIVYFTTRPATQKIATQAVKRQDLTQTLTVTGSIDSTKSVNLNFLTGGKLVYLGVKQGDQVKKSQTIALLDERTVQNNLQTALRDYSIQRNTFDQSHADNNAKTPNDAVNDSLKRILQNNQYDLDKAVISVELQNLAQEQSVLITPINGIVTRADVDTAGVNISATTTFTITDPNSLVFKMEIDEADIGMIKIGQPVSLTLDAYPDQTLHLQVDSIDYVSHATSTGGTAYYVKAKIIPNAKDNYRIGLNGNADITLQKVINVITVPIASVIDNTYIYVKNGTKFEKKKVKLGLANDTEQEIISGLQEGESVVIDPTQVQK